MPPNEPIKVSASSLIDELKLLNSNVERMTDLLKKCINKLDELNTNVKTQNGLIISVITSGKVQPKEGAPTIPPERQVFRPGPKISGLEPPQWENNPTPLPSFKKEPFIPFTKTNKES